METLYSTYDLNGLVTAGLTMILAAEAVLANGDPRSEGVIEYDLERNLFVARVRTPGCRAASDVLGVCQAVSAEDVARDILAKHLSWQGQRLLAGTSHEIQAMLVDMAAKDLAELESA